MKKLLSFSAFVLLVSGVCFAQQTQHKTPQEKADMQTQKLTQELSLTADQVPKVKALLLQTDQQAEAIRAKYQNSADKTAEHAEMKTLHQQKDAGLKQILTADQYTKYESTKNSSGHGNGGGHQHHGGHGH